MGSSRVVLLGRATAADRPHPDRPQLPGPHASGPPVRKAPKLTVPPHCAVAEAFQRIIGADLAHFLGYAPPAQAGDVEGVHQLRAALRRLRAALVLFAPVLRPDGIEPIGSELKRLGRVFGAARDWDVFCLKTLPHAAAELPEPAWALMLARTAEPQREMAHRPLGEQLGGAASVTMAAVLRAWVDGREPAPFVDGSAGRTLAELGPRLLGRLARKVEKRGGRIGRRSDAELHALRKSLKKLRYGSEDLGSLYKPKRRKRYLRRCERLLDVLGAINDAAVTKQLLDQLGENADADLAPAVSSLRDWSDAERTKARHRLRKTWRAFGSEEPFWK